MVKFAWNLNEVEDIKEVFNHLSNKQIKAVREVLQPQEITVVTDEKEITKDVDIQQVAGPDWRVGKATARAYAKSVDGVEVWSFGVEATWEFSGSSVRNVSSTHAVSTNHYMWHWKNMIDENERVHDDSCVVYKQGKFSYCEPIGLGCLKSHTPYIEHYGYEDGSSHTESNYKTN
ncbi:hypothetical protein [Haladaptatus cibarius]|uniref:hypothetical protein n=1 Tax=Haladaptatus cibarius TaxID=453847 RepID=UPI001184AE49|nr:hypothetical protein [Haladaptatus cibarius]